MTDVQIESMVTITGAEYVRLTAEVERLRAALERTIALAELVTIKQVIDAGDEVIEAAGLNPWCIAEGLADGSEPVSLWWAYSALGGDT